MDEVVTLLQSILDRLGSSELVYTTHELALKLKTHDQRIDLYRNEGLISAIKVSFIPREQWISSLKTLMGWICPARPLFRSQKLKSQKEKGAPRVPAVEAQDDLIGMRSSLFYHRLERL